MYSRRFSAIAAVVMFCFASPAGAQEIPPGQQGGEAQAPARQQQTILGPEEAIRIANQHGVQSVEEIERDDHKWEIEGRDVQGREIEIEIDIRTGQVLDIDR